MEIQSHTSLHLVVLLHWYYIGITLVIHWYYIGILLQYWSPGIVLILYCLTKASIVHPCHTGSQIYFWNFPYHNVQEKLFIFCIKFPNPVEMGRIISISIRTDTLG
jgi:hypothetical protein